MSVQAAQEHAQDLDLLAETLGITRSYYDGTGRQCDAADEAVFAVIRALGAPVERIEDCADALRAIRAAAAAGRPPVVAVFAQGQGGTIALPQGNAATVTLESGETLRLRTARAGDAGLIAAIPRELPAGYHLLRLDGAQADAVKLHVVPPRLPGAPRAWCLLAPLYGLRGSGDRSAVYGDLRRLAAWMTERRGASRHHRDTALIGTLPLLACFFEEPFEPSPYSPISRAFWSELYVDPGDERGRSPAPLPAPAREPSPAGRRIDYRGEMRERRREIRALLDAVDAAGGRRREQLEVALEEDDELARYAAFRAAVDQHGTTWPQWPERARSGRLRAGVDYDGETFRYHAFAQLLAREQVAAVAAGSGAGLYLDLPLGCHAGGYDTWRYAGDFVAGMSAGAPPDAVFEGGQNWTFPPLHPERLRAGGYASLRAALRHHFGHASLLRIDHVMGLHRSFWIPDGFSAADGVYVRSHKDEMWGVVTIEAARARSGRGAAVVGEDLGTVPDEVRAEMEQRGALRMHVVPFEYRDDPAAPLLAPPRDALACLGTHDMEPFATWWEQPWTPRDLVRDFLGCGESPDEVLAALLEWLSAADATVVCANLEDFWLERERQNLPGTEAGERNWQRTFARDFGDFSTDEAVCRLRDLTRGADAPARAPQEPR